MFCWLRQWRISSALDDGRDIPAGLQRHAERCDHCKTFLEGSRRLGVALRDGASTLDVSVPQVTPRPAWQRWAPLAAAAAIIVAAIVLWMSLVSGPPESTAHNIVKQRNPLEKLDISSRMPIDWASDYLAEIPKAADESMYRELSGLSRDTEAAARKLVSYLPRIPVGSMN